MKISVITVCFDSAATIADALRSVDAQDWADKEHWIVDGASRDATLSVVAAHAQPWRHVQSERDKGIYDAMNKGLKLATGEVIGLLNSDDFYAAPDVLSRVAAAFEDPNLDACWGDLCYVRQDRPEQVVRYWQSSDFRPGMFRSGWCPPHPTFFVRRRVYERFGGFDLGYRMGNDIELMVRFLEVHCITTRYLPGRMVTMRMGGASNQSLRAVLLQNREIWRAMTRHGMRPSLLAFAGGKLVSRAKQFLSRPS